MRERAAGAGTRAAAKRGRGAADSDGTRRDEAGPASPGAARAALASAAEIAALIVEHHRADVRAMANSPQRSLLRDAAPRIIATVKACADVIAAAAPGAAQGAEDLAADVRAQVAALGPAADDKGGA